MTDIPRQKKNALAPFFTYKKTRIKRVVLYGGEGGIRTLGTVRYTHFPGVLFRPLRHLSKFRGSTLHKAGLKRNLPLFDLVLALRR